MNYSVIAELPAMSKLMVLKTFNSPFEANLYKAKLADAGVFCTLQDENIIGIHPATNYALGGIKLKIREQDEIVARKILEN